MWSKSLIVGIVASLIDMLLMLVLSSVGVGDQMAFIVATSIGIIIQFIGNHVWSFHTTRNESVFRRAAMFFVFEVVVMLALSFIFPLIISFIEREIKDFWFILQDGHMTPIGNVITKHIIAFVVFNFVSYPMWKYVIFDKKRN